jgi:hypothetical protein
MSTQKSQCAGSVAGASSIDKLPQSILPSLIAFGGIGMTDEECVDALLQESEDFRRIKEEHAWFHRKVEKLDAKPYLTPAEKVQRGEFKKRKLLLKDRMEQMLAEYRRRVEGDS